MKKTILSASVLALSLAAAPAFAAPGDPVKVSDDLTLDPIVEGRLRYEGVDQDDLSLKADSVTMRLRAGVEAKLSNLSLLIEGEGTLAIGDNYNDTIAGNHGYLAGEPYSVVADPETIELNRIQFSYKNNGNGVTAGRQRINLDDQRWVGSVAWRQNEQTFDAVRGEGKIGPLMLDATYAWSQRTIFGVDAGPRQSFDGDFLFLGASAKLGPVNVKGFGYFLDYDVKVGAPPSSKTLGLRATTALPITTAVKIDLTGSYARQSDYKNAGTPFKADYIAGEAGVTFSGLRVGGGYELLGSDNGRALQTPMATAHKFNGWADLFLTTPVNGLQDIYGVASYKVGDIGMIKGLTAMVAFHEFDSDKNGIDYGSEWNAQLTFKVKQFMILAKYASYNAKSFGTDTDKFWLELNFAY